MSFLKTIILIASTMLAFNAHARSAVPIINYDDIPIVTNSGKSVQLKDFKQAVMEAAGDKNWVISDATADDSMLATLVVRNKHTIVVKINYSPEKYSMHYQDSINMKYGTRNKSTDDVPVIHPFYNKWVKGFKGEISAELLKL